jgi:hypothetical protein
MKTTNNKQYKESNIMAKNNIDTTSNSTTNKPRRVDPEFITSIMENWKLFQDFGLSPEEIKIKNPLLYKQYNEIVDGQLLAKGSRAFTMVDEFMKLNSDHPLTKFVEKFGRQFEFTRETGKKGIIRVNGSNATS